MYIYLSDDKLYPGNRVYVQVADSHGGNNVHDAGLFKPFICVRSFRGWLFASEYREVSANIFVV